MKILGIDPGKTGAIALFDSDVGRNGEITQIWDMPCHWVQVSGKPRSAVSATGVQQVLLEAGATHAVIEKVGGLPGQSGAASFVFGFGVGLIHASAIALALEIENPSPMLWKAKMRAPKNKNAARARATEMLPHARHWWPNVGHDGRAEAALLALYGARHVWPMLLKDVA
jgi:crossover junction endodeoxyribonuclease RuvC